MQKGFLLPLNVSVCVYSIYYVHPLGCHSNSMCLHLGQALSFHIKARINILVVLWFKSIVRV